MVNLYYIRCLRSAVAIKGVTSIFINILVATAGFEPTIINAMLATHNSEDAKIKGVQYNWVPACTVLIDFWVASASSMQVAIMSIGE